MMEGEFPECINIMRRNIGMNGQSNKLPLLCHITSTIVKTLSNIKKLYMVIFDNNIFVVYILCWIRKILNDSGLYKTLK